MQLERSRIVGVKAPHTNHDNFIHPKGSNGLLSPASPPRNEKVKHSEFARNSLYMNDLTSRQKYEELGRARTDHSPTSTSYALEHGDPMNRQKRDHGTHPTLDDMKNKYISINKERYDAILKSKPYLPRNVSRRVNENLK